MKKTFALTLVSAALLAGSAQAQDKTGYLFYAGGVTADARTAETGLGVLDAGGTNPNTDAMVPTVYVANVVINAGNITITNWRYAADFVQGNPIPLDNPDTTGTVEQYSWIYVSHNVHAYNGKLYVGPGDWNGDSNFDTAGIVAYADINQDGSLGTWSFSEAIPGDLAINASGLVDVDGAGGEEPYLYVFGANGDASTYYAQVQPDGSLGTWTQGTDLPDGDDWFHGGTQIGDKLIYGSGNLGAAPPALYYNTISSGGTMAGTWTSTGDWTTGDETGARWAYAIDTVTAPGGNPHIIITCGNGAATDDGVYTNEVASGIPGSWVKQTEVVPSPVRNVTGVGIDNFFVVVGGSTANTAGTSLNAVRVGTMDASGVVTWKDDSDATVDALPETRSYGGAAFFESEFALAADNWSMYE